MSLGAYVPIWFGLSWAELRRETGEERMSPVWHALSIFVPVYGVFQAYRHFQVLGAAAARVGVTRAADAMSAAVGVLIWWLTFTHYSSEPIFLALDAVELAAGTAVVLYGQRALNAYWRARPGPAVEERLLEVDRIALVIAAIYFVVTILGFLSPSS